MKTMCKWGALSLVLGFCMVAGAVAGELIADNRALEKKRSELEQQRAEYEKKLKALTDTLEKTASQLNDCVYQTRLKTLKSKHQQFYENWRKIWESRLREAEIARKSAEEERRRIIKLWRELGKVREQLEARRQAIEKQFEGNRQDPEYESQFRQYMNQMRTEYFQKIEKQLFSGYESYLEGAKGYLRFLKNSLDLCRSDEGNQQG